MYSTRTRVNARIPNGHPREENRASGQKSGRQVGELNGPRAPRQADFRARRTRRLPREDPRTEVGEEVRVGPVEFSYNGTYERQVRGMAGSGEEPALDGGRCIEKVR